MGHQRDRKHKVDLVIKGFMAGEGPVEETLPVSTKVVKKCIYEVRPECDSGIPSLLTTVLKDNRKLLVKGKLTNAELVIVLQKGEETPVVTTVTDENFKVFLKLRKGDKIAFGFTAGDDFLVDFKALVMKHKRKCKCKRECECKHKRKCKRECKCNVSVSVNVNIRR